MSRTPDPPPPVRYLTLAQARALECNGCGDCCDSRRTEGYWTWGSLPPDGYAAQCEGVPLIIPLERLDGEWRDRPHRPSDIAELSPTRFRCAAFVETPPTEALPDGGGMCGRHDRWRPDRCGEFPVGAPSLEGDVERLGAVNLETDAFPRCTWYRVTVVRDDDPRAERS